MSNFLTQNNHKNYGVSLDLGNNEQQAIRTDHIKKHKRNITQPLNEPITPPNNNNTHNNMISYLATASMTPSSSYSNNFVLTNNSNSANGKIKCKT